MENRKGSIILTREFINSLDVEVFKLLFSNFYPINIERIGFDDLLYYGYSEHFRECKDDEIVAYDIDVELHYNGEFEHHLIFKEVESI